MQCWILNSKKDSQREAIHQDVKGKPKVYKLFLLEKDLRILGLKRRGLVGS